MHETIDIHIPAPVLKILKTLNDGGYGAYIVGGCVRDCLRGGGANVNDWDITTSALPEDVMRLFSHCRETGLKHGTVTVIIGPVACEVTTYRIDGEYVDSRHPEKVTFTPSLEEDLARRDFTVNAMAYHPHTGLVDLHGGISDLNEGVIRCVNDPARRFREDALRMLRAVRFCAQLGFRLDPGTFCAIASMAFKLNEISAERISAELRKLLSSDFPENISLLSETGMLKIILPELMPMIGCSQNHPYHSHDVWTHTIHAIKYASKEHECVRIALLFHDCGKPAHKTTDSMGIDHFKGHPETSAKICRDVLRRLKFPNELIDTVTVLVKYHDAKFPADLPGIKRAINKIGKSEFPMLLEVRHADIQAHSRHKQDESFAYLKRIKELYHQCLASNDCIDLAHLAVNGDDLAALGFYGKAIGDALKHLLNIVIDHPEYNDKEKLLKLAVKQ